MVRIRRIRAAQNLIVVLLMILLVSSVICTGVVVWRGLLQEHRYMGCARADSILVFRP